MYSRFILDLYTAESNLALRHGRPQEYNTHYRLRLDDGTGLQYGVPKEICISVVEWLWYGRVSCRSRVRSMQSRYMFMLCHDDDQ